MARKSERISGAPAAPAAVDGAVEAEGRPSAAGQNSDGLIRVRVIGPEKGRRRIGRAFGKEAVEIDVTADELVALKSDPTLSVMELAS